MFFKISQMQSVSILSISVQPCFSFLLLYFVYVDQVIAMCPPTFGHFECHEFFLDIAPFSLLLVNISAPRGFFTIVSSIWLSLPKMPISVNFQIYYWNWANTFERQVTLWSSQLWMQFLQLRKEAWKIQDFNGVRTRDLTIPMQRSNQLSYEATDVGCWSFVGSNVPVKNESTMKWYMKWIIYELRIWNQVMLWSSQLWMQFLQLHKEAWKFQDFIASLDFISAVHI